MKRGRKCKEKTAQGKPCKRLAMKDSELCASHAGVSHRPTLLHDQKLREDLIRAIRVGAYNDEAAARVGITASSFYSWMEKGEAAAAQLADGTKPPGDGALFAEFYEAITRAQAEARVHAVTALRRGMADDWRAAAHFLERKDPQRWGRRVVVGDDADPAKRGQAKSVAELVEAAEELLRENGVG